MVEVVHSRASIPLRETTVPLLLELCLRDLAATATVVAVAAAANGEGRTCGVDWNDGSLCSVGRSDPVLSGLREDNVSSSPREIRREGKTAKEVERRRGSDVK